MAPRLTAIVIALGLGAGLALTPTAPAAAGAESATGARTVGEPGSGPAPWRPHVSRAALFRGRAITWSDVTRGFWAKAAIDYVGGSYAWMRDFAAGADGSYPFKPDKLESRKLFARAIVEAFAPDAAVDPSLTFKDLPSTAPFYPYVNVAVQQGWMRSTKSTSAFYPDAPVTMSTVHQALVFALGLKPVAYSLNQIHTRNGFVFDTPAKFGTTLLGMRLGLRYNHSDESLDVNPSSQLSRAEVAYSLYRAKTAPSWLISEMADQYLGIQLPTLGPKKEAFIQWGIKFVGYPYVWGGEWGSPTGSGYCCGTQPVGGFDCSGLTWWVMRHVSPSYSPPRDYAGWALPQRVSRDMATVGNVGFKQLEVGDLMFYDGDGDGIVDHVDTYIGNGYALDSSSTPGGVTIMWVGTGWYADHFVHGRRIIT